MVFLTDNLQTTYIRIYSKYMTLSGAISLQFYLEICHDVSGKKKDKCEITKGPPLARMIFMIEIQS